MRYSIIILIPLFISFNSFAQNKICGNQTLMIYLNTEEIVYHQINKPYNPVKPKVISAQYDSNFITLKYVDGVNQNKIGLYYSQYVARDTAGVTISCVRYVRIVDSTAIIRDITPLMFSVYPNPVHGTKFTIDLKNFSSENIYINIYDLQGRKVFSYFFTTSSKSNFIVPFENNELDNGLYTLNVKQGNKSTNKLIIIQ